MKTMVLVWVLVLVHKDAKDGVTYGQDLGRPFSHQNDCEAVRSQLLQKIKILPDDKLECFGRYVEGQVISPK